MENIIKTSSELIILASPFQCELTSDYKIYLSDIKTHNI